MLGSEGFGGKEWTEGGERSVFLPCPFTQTQGPFLQLDRRYDEACYFKQAEQVHRKGGGAVYVPTPFLLKRLCWNSSTYGSIHTSTCSNWCTGIVKLYIMSCVAALYYHQIRLEDKRNMPNEPFSNPLSRR